MIFGSTARISRQVADSGLFDPDWYRSRHRDVSLTGLDPLAHYVRYGHRLGRDPGPQVSTAFLRAVFGLAETREPIATLGLAADAAGRAAPRRPHRWRIDESIVLKVAAAVADGGRPHLALDLARQWLPPHLAHTASLMAANLAVRQDRDEAAWLTATNAYLSAHGMMPVALDPPPSLGNSGTMPPLTTRLRPAQPVPRAAGATAAEAPLVSVLMPVWNAAATLTSAARSILGQTWPHLELLIVDDASDDDSFAIARQLAAADPRVRVWRNSANVGPYVSKNIAMTQARGAWITGHDADDWAHPERIARQLAACREPDTTACFAGMVRLAPDGCYVRMNPIGGHVHDGACRDAFVSLMVDARVFHGALGAWDNVRMAGDSELIHRLRDVLGIVPVPVKAPTLFCLDNAQGLTNHPLLGHSETGGVSAPRRAYKAAFTAHHRTLDPMSSRYRLQAGTRPFRVPPQMVDSALTIAGVLQDHVARGLRWRRDIDTDVAIVTNLRFPGGNASSTLDEVRLFQSQGLRVTLVHAPVRRDIARAISVRYAPLSDLIVDWTRIGTLTAKVMILRHPAVITSPTFERILDRLHAGATFAVKNNSQRRNTGEQVYDLGRMLDNLGRVDAGRLEVCPISPAMRAELETFAQATGRSIPLSARDWTPTLDPAQYVGPPKAQMPQPWRIGRHGRDGPEKWHEQAAMLRAAYPDDPRFRIVMLGGTSRAGAVLGRLPNNWESLAFGERAPGEYLAGLDAFVYLPHSGLVEGFGRAVAEAMMAGVPCLLPEAFRQTFGELAFYVTPGQVASVVALLAQEDAERVAFLTETQAIALDRYATSTMAQRFVGTGLLPDAQAPAAPLTLSAASRAWRSRLLARAQKGGPARQA